MILVIQFTVYSDDFRFTGYDSILSIPSNSKYFEPIITKPTETITLKSLSPGMSVMRKIDSTGKCILFVGRIITGEKSELIPIGFPSDISLDTLVTFKFFTQPQVNPNSEIGEAYFTRFGTVYFVKVSTVNYFYNGKWNTAKVNMVATNAKEQARNEAKSTTKALAWTLGILGGILVLCISIAIIGELANPPGH